MISQRKCQRAENGFGSAASPLPTINTTYRLGFILSVHQSELDYTAVCTSLSLSLFLSSLSVTCSCSSASRNRSVHTLRLEHSLNSISLHSCLYGSYKSVLGIQVTIVRYGKLKGFFTF